MFLKCYHGCTGKISIGKQTKCAKIIKCAKIRILITFPYIAGYLFTKKFHTAHVCLFKMRDRTDYLLLVQDLDNFSILQVIYLLRNYTWHKFAFLKCETGLIIYCLFTAHSLRTAAKWLISHLCAAIGRGVSNE